MLWNILRGVLGILFLMALWFAVQAFLRRRAHAAPDRDVLEDMCHHCGECQQSGSCEEPREKRRSQHETQRV